MTGNVSGLASAIEGEKPGVTSRAGAKEGADVSALASRFEKASVTTKPAAKVSSIASKFAQPMSPGMRRVPSGKRGAPVKATPTKKPEEISTPAVAGLASRFEQAAPPAMLRVPSNKSAPKPATTAVAAKSASGDDAPASPRVRAVAERFSGGAREDKPGGSAFAAAQGAFLKAESAARSTEPASRVKAAASVFGDTVLTATGVSPLKRDDSKVEKQEKKQSGNVVKERAQSVTKVASLFEKGEATTKKEGEEDGGPSLKERFAGASKVFGGSV